MFVSNECIAAKKYKNPCKFKKWLPKMMYNHIFLSKLFNPYFSKFNENQSYKV